MVMPEQPAEPSVASDLACYWRWTITYDRAIPNPLVWPFVVVVLNTLGDQIIKMLPPNWDEVIKALDFE